MLLAMHEIHTKKQLKIYLKNIEGKYAIYWKWVIMFTGYIKGPRDGHDSNYFLDASVVVQIPGTCFFDKSSMKLMQVCQSCSALH